MIWRFEVSDIFVEKNYTKMHKDIDFQLLKSIADLSKFYKEEFLKDKKGKINHMLNDFWEADLEFIRYLFPRGRRDELSFYFTEVGMSLIKEHFGDDENEIREKLENFDKSKLEKSLGNKKPQFFNLKQYEERYIQAFDRKPKSISKLKLELSNPKDHTMILEAFEFISKNCRENNYNIYLYSKHRIEKGDIKGLFNDLNEIKEVGPKLSSLFLRDLVHVFLPEHKFRKDDFKYLFPVDTWVRQIAKETGVCDENANDKELISKIVEFCHRENIDVMDFNAGAWYLGSQPFRLYFKHGLIYQVKNII